jgi:hypothetical protein
MSTAHVQGSLLEPLISYGCPPGGIVLDPDHHLICCHLDCTNPGAVTDLLEAGAAS